MTEKQEENLQPSNCKKDKVNKSNKENSVITSKIDNDSISEGKDGDSNNSNNSNSIPIQIIDRQIGIRLKKRRSELYISQTRLANALGLTFQQVQKYEKGKNRLSSSRMFQIAKILQVDLNYFFDGLITQEKLNSDEQEILGFNETEGKTENCTTVAENKTQESIIKAAVNLEKDPIIRSIRKLEKEVWKIRAREKAGYSYEREQAWCM